jgi:hypothetical protein
MRGCGIFFSKTSILYIDCKVDKSSNKATENALGERQVFEVDLVIAQDK